MSDTPQLVVGTAGHIDHGKSRLVLALTGTDPDRLPEEKNRGMTIDLGFAHANIADCDIWFVDVPGHERFIRHMVAGATGVDLALLVVAADDSVMPQTREHAELLSLLGIERCVVALSKMDLVDDEWAEQVEEEVAELLEAQKIKPLRMVRTSTETGRGLDELRTALAELARSGEAQRQPYNWFRLPIDRAFNIPGRGTVVTGSVAHGTIQPDDELDLCPAGRRVRARDLQTHHDHTTVAAGRMRLAVNLAGVPLDQVQRGCQLATPGYLTAARCLDVWLASLRMPGKIRRKKIRLRLHIATSEVLAELRLLSAPTSDRLSAEFAQLLVAEPVVATWGEHFIVRDESGNRTLGGGRVLRPVSRPWRAKRPAHPDGLRALLEGNATERLEEVVRANEWHSCGDDCLAARAGLADASQAVSVREPLEKSGRITRFDAGGSPTWAHVCHLDELVKLIPARLSEHLDANPRLPGLPRSEWPGWMPQACPPRLRAALADWMVQKGHVSLVDGFIVPRGQRGGMSEKDETLFKAILQEYADAAFQPPALSALHCRTPRNEKRLRELIDFGAARGQLVRIADGLWLHGEHHAQMISLVTQALRERGQLAVADIRTLLNSSRKYVVPIAEHLDATGITRRDGDHRKLGPKAPSA